jgi:hypothetical protein
LLPGQTHSRAVEFAIDEARLEVSQVWEYGAHLAQPLFANALGDADWLPVTGHVLITFGQLAAPTADVPSARIREVTHAAPADLVFELDVFDGRHVYRADRIPDLYPDG